MILILAMSSLMPFDALWTLFLWCHFYPHSKLVSFNQLLLFLSRVSAYLCKCHILHAEIRRKPEVLVLSFHFVWDQVSYSLLHTSDWWPVDIWRGSCLHLCFHCGTAGIIDALHLAWCVLWSQNLHLPHFFSLLYKTTLTFWALRWTSLSLLIHLVISPPLFQCLFSYSCLKRSNVYL